jgi:hypothetical protein
MLTATAPSSEARAYAAAIWRLVESQAAAATMLLTDTLLEQARLEQLIDNTKPAFPAACAGYDFLIATPFRYAPYPQGSRFRRARQTEGAFYAAEAIETAVAETAFYRLLFFLDAPGMTWPGGFIERTAFSVRVKSSRMIDLTAAPFAADAASWEHPTDYAACQALADQARQEKIDIIRYKSVRCPKGGANLAVLDIAAILDHHPKQRQTWHLFLRERAAQAWCESPRLRLEFRFADWAARDPRVARHLGV